MLADRCSKSGNVIILKFAHFWSLKFHKLRSNLLFYVKKTKDGWNLLPFQKKIPFQSLLFQFWRLEVRYWNGMEFFFSGSWKLDWTGIFFTGSWKLDWTGIFFTGSWKLDWTGIFFHWKLKTGMEWNVFSLEVGKFDWNGIFIPVITNSNYYWVFNCNNTG